MYLNLYLTQNGVFTEDGRMLTPTGQSSTQHPSTSSNHVPNAEIGSGNYTPVLGGGRANFDPSLNTPARSSADPRNGFQYQQPTPSPCLSPDQFSGGVNGQNLLRGGGSLGYGYPDVYYDPFALSYLFEAEDIRGGSGPPDQFCQTNHPGQQGAGGQVQVFTFDASGQLNRSNQTEGEQGASQAQQSSCDFLGGLQIEVDGVPLDLSRAVVQQVAGAHESGPQGGLPPGPAPPKPPRGIPNIPPGPAPPKPPRGIPNVPPGSAPPKPQRDIPSSKGTSQGAPPPKPPRQEE